MLFRGVVLGSVATFVWSRAWRRRNHSVSMRMLESSRRTRALVRPAPWRRSPPRNDAWPAPARPGLRRLNRAWERRAGRPGRRRRVGLFGFRPFPGRRALRESEGPKLTGRAMMSEEEAARWDPRTAGASCFFATRLRPPVTGTRA